MYYRTAKYKKVDQQAAIYQNSLSKVSLINKYEIKAKNKVKTKADYMASSYRKSNISSTHKKYTKKARAAKKSINSSSRMNEQGSMLGSNTSKLSPTGNSIQKRGVEKSSLNTKSYNSLMTMLMNKDQEI